MARDAIARQFDVDKNSVKLDIPNGTITFFARKGKSINLQQIHASLQATRLSGRTGMEIRDLEITAVGSVLLVGTETRLKVPGTRQHLLLGDAPNTRPRDGEKTPFRRLREALAKGSTVARVTGWVHGWRGPFPQVLRDPAGDPPMLIVTDFETVKR